VKREHHRWFSRSLERDMDLLVFGHGGARVLAFPTSMGRFFDWEDRGMVAALGEHLEQGRLQLVCLDSVDRESWYAGDRTPAERARRHDQYDHYVHDEVLPFTLEQNMNSFLIVAGAGFGGYHAVNFAFRHPETVGRVLGLSGQYDIRCFADGYHDETVYFHNPCEFLAHEHEPARLEALRGLDIILAVGRDDPNRANNELLSGILWGKDVWHALRIWDGSAHDWPCWQQMLRLYIGGHD
jgi:esterase/lipase superfamily enzyme